MFKKFLKSRKKASKTKKKIKQIKAKKVKTKKTEVKQPLVNKILTAEGWLRRQKKSI